MGKITVAVFLVVFLLLWGRLFYYFHTHKDALASLGIDNLGDSFFLKLLLSFVSASFLAVLVILAGEFALEMIFAYWYVTAIMVGLMTLAVTENGRKTAIVAGIAAVIGFFGNYFINADLGSSSAGGQGHPSSQAAQQGGEASSEAGQASASGEEQAGQQQEPPEQPSDAQQGKESKAAAEDGKKESGKKEEKKPPVSNEVALGSISIGQSMSNAQELLGKELEAKHSESTAQTRYRYADADVIADSNGVVIGFASNSDKLSTPRGIKQGSPVDEVLRMYGKPFAQSERDGATLYEYHLASDGHKPCLLRFSIKNSQVDYISGRLLE